MAEDTKNTTLEENELQSAPEKTPENQEAKSAAKKSSTNVKSDDSVLVPNRIKTHQYDEREVITVDRFAGGYGDEENMRQEIAWHEIENSYHRRKSLSGIISGVEPFSVGGKTINVVVADYKGMRVIIPVDYMNVLISAPDKTEEEINEAKSKICSSMTGADIDFTVIALDKKAHSIMASRQLAMNAKMHDMFIAETAKGHPMVQVGSIVEAKILSVATTVVRLEIFGVETLTSVYKLQNRWVSNARDRYFVGDKVRVRITEIIYSEDHKKVEGVFCEARSLNADDIHMCKPGATYSGEVTRVNSGVYSLYLNVGTNALAHTSLRSRREPQKEDQVRFYCTKMDEEKGLAIGQIISVIRPHK
ncbi:MULTISPECIES: S1 RNA-binding domain-containing protein [Clostridia]|uniref:S1 RNA-binding domain-containing protein n=1 Tax=Clostridia TaxID=186801 RepID=UPI000E4E4ABC|nr:MULTISPECIES: S1 RNA-binding domain-containing protein [Clostridia]RHV70260.1 S1 RNA-binding domain-containing protein [Roseburia sp. OM02-15]